MALVFDSSGNASVENRLAFPVDGRFINNHRMWDFLKSMVNNEIKFEITIQSVEETFNAIKDPITGITLRSSCDQFESFLKSNDRRFTKKDFSYQIIF